ncbi:hypothetical protein BDV30DRAFT_211248 [Aspergillus minisclerotigenes]|uniref:Uncharacterized protein n=1 Tax=Aspergillus minisclerotigenes TaxID=656917 RepID=A0A5N6J5G2_9EURO|nr:hypothetical protein BDV30DRAFT_211248 [Aspergillus minisclerotigenes]
MVHPHRGIPTSRSTKREKVPNDGPRGLREWVPQCPSLTKLVHPLVPFIRDSPLGSKD